MIIKATGARRYVELGTHFGMSLFAAQQASDALGGTCECIGIDTWLGDEHAGRFGEDVFEGFRSTAASIGGSGPLFIRATFDEARPLFADGSVDVLLIDGLHTYEAVAHDFRTWLPTMSDKGIVLLHDTRVRDRGFGVWRLWSEIRDRFPSVEISHTHGLGVAFVGALDSRLHDLVSSLRDEPAASILESVLLSLGEQVVRERDLAATAAEAGRMRDMFHQERDFLLGEREAITAESMEWKHRAGQTDAAERQRDSHAEALAALERSFSWRATAPLRLLHRKIRGRAR